jgi:hypothetical protein
MAKQIVVDMGCKVKSRWTWAWKKRIQKRAAEMWNAVMIPEGEEKT